ncbi:hypothetical protein AN958_07840 [Leucoagaricus sp. SymC.cos]|nr:hypothetical protein AN958_07840 [Leucoagaricus sp. SymC.cos]
MPAATRSSKAQAKVETTEKPPLSATTTLVPIPDDSDSDSDFDNTSLDMGISLQSGLIVSTNACPLLPDVPRDQITAQLLIDYDRQVRGYCRGLKKPPADEKAMLIQVLHMSTSTCTVVANYVSALGNKLDNKTWKEWVEMLKEHFLEKDWAIKLRRKLLDTRMSPHDHFNDWVETLISYNNRLVDTDCHLDDKTFIETVNRLLCSDLQIAADRAGLMTKTDFDEYRKDVMELDRRRLERIEEIQREAQAIFESYSQQAKRDASKMHPNAPSSFRSRRTHDTKTTLSSAAEYSHLFKHPFYPTRPSCSSRAISAHSSATYVPGSHNAPPPPKLTEDERKILVENKGCTKCRKIAPPHMLEHRGCDESLPSGTNYRPVAYKATGNHPQSTATSSSTTPSTSTSSNSSAFSSSLGKRANTNRNDRRSSKRAKPAVNAVDGSDSSNDWDDFDFDFPAPVASVDAGDTSVSSFESDNSTHYVPYSKAHPRYVVDYRGKTTPPTPEWVRDFLDKCAQAPANIPDDILPPGHNPLGSEIHRRTSLEATLSSHNLPPRDEAPSQDASQQTLIVSDGNLEVQSVSHNLEAQASA